MYNPATSAPETPTVIITVIITVTVTVHCIIKAKVITFLCISFFGFSVWSGRYSCCTAEIHEFKAGQSAFILDADSF